jgi:hypothetical protein
MGFVTSFRVDAYGRKVERRRRRGWRRSWAIIQCLSFCLHEFCECTSTSAPVAIPAFTRDLMGIVRTTVKTFDVVLLVVEEVNILVSYGNSVL